MGRNKCVFSGCILFVALSFVLNGCAVNLYKQSPRSKKQIKTLETKIDELERQRMEERAKFEEVKHMLERQLREQIEDENISLTMDERGLVIIVADEILFDSGKAEVKDSAIPVLGEVAVILSDKMPDKNIGISGHTDNIPITHSKWKSNWELSTTRATNVLHHIVEKGVSPKKMSATGYGEHRPLKSNDTAEGRAANRRVEIIILPEFEEKREGSVDVLMEEDSIK